MLFNSLQFLVFFPIITLLYFASPHRYRWFILLSASVYFYMSFVPIYILILAGTIVVDYFAGRMIESSPVARKKFFLILSILANIGVLFFFKYFNFFNQNINFLAESFGINYPVPDWEILLPIGLSFHTFQSLSYIIEVYRGRQVAEKRLGIFALYVMFYPQLVAGPIERPQNLLPQFAERHRFEFARVAAGLKLMLWGFFKKVFISDRLAYFVDQVFDHAPDYNGVAILVAAVFFAIQIYCDFSGYSDIAIGSARVMGFKLMDNFRQPYFSTSIAEFWKRWHISLSTWFRDYLFIPLCRGHLTFARYAYFTLLVFLISGLWHGANWTFVIWGGLHGFYLIASRLKNLLKHRARSRFPALFRIIPDWLVKAWQVSATFSLVCFSLIFFRAKNLGVALAIIKQFFSGWEGILANLRTFAFNARNIFLNQGEAEFKLAIIGIAILIIVDLIKSNERALKKFESAPVTLRYSVYFTALFALAALCDWQGRQFIYFQF